MKDILINGAKNAGEILKEDFFKSKNVSNKGIADLVTETDVKIEVFLKKYFHKHLPIFKFIGEESSDSLDLDGKCLIVDPIDGTTNFVHGFPFVAISIGVYEDMVPIEGVVYNPILGEMFYAKRGGGAFLNNIPIKVSKEKKLVSSLIATGFPYEFVKKNRKDILGKLENILINSHGIRRAGAASLDLCYVAKGSFDGYYEGGLKPWDVAAGVLIVKEAGGLVTDLKGNDYLFESEYILATNKNIHNELIEVLNDF